MKKITNLLSLFAIIATIVISFAFESSPKVLPNTYSIVGETTNSYIIGENLVGEAQGTDYTCSLFTGARCKAVQTNGTTYVFAPAGGTTYKISKLDPDFTFGPTDELFTDLFLPPSDND